MGGFDDLGGGLGGGLGGLDASTRERDLANARNQDAMGGFEPVANSLSDVATQGMGEGLSAMKDSRGMDDDSMSFGAALADEEPDEPIHAALADEEEEEPIHAGRSVDESVNAGFDSDPVNNYSSSQDEAYSEPKKAEERSSFSSYGYGGTDMANDSRQNIDDIFIGGRNNSFSGMGGGTSATGGTMYDPSQEHTNVHVSVGVPPIIKKLIGLVIFLAVVYVGLVYGLKINVGRYFNPVDVQDYVEADQGTLESVFKIKMEQDDEHFSNSSDFDYTYNVTKYGGLRLVDCDGKRLYIEVTDFRIDFSIYGIRPLVDDYDAATSKLTANGFTYVEGGDYDNSEELGSQGIDYCFYNSKTGAGVIIGKKSSSSRVRSVIYVKNYKKFIKTRNQLRNIQ